ncbi:acyl-CoA synthetase (NDP forming) [Cellulomonas sp. PhB143]|nr:acyl-CoA synthetase (NDP forming) [Cellulomonas sp. PhB143]
MRYPVEWEADVVLRDGTTAHVRPIRPSDSDALQRFHGGQSERSVYLRFFVSMSRLSARDLRRFTEVDHRDRVALVAVRTGPDGEEIIGVGRFDRVEPTQAEVAFNIADAVQGRGVGSVLLEHLAAAAREVGVRRFTAEVLPQNGRMIAVFREAGYQLEQRMDDGVVQVGVDLDPTDRSREVMADREHRAEARSVERLLAAEEVLVLGPGEGDTTSAQAVAAARVAQGVVTNGLACHTTGVAPALAGEGLGDEAAGLLHAWPSVADVPRTVGLAVLALSPPAAIRAVPELEAAGVPGAVVVSSGFGETGEAGLAAQRELLRAAHAAGMRIVGPASYGLIASAQGRTLDASLTGDVPPAGDVGFFCQSAPTAVTLLATVRRRGIGVSAFVSAGHRADVSGNDLMQYWVDDPATQVVCLNLESIGNPRKFSRIARRLARVKPVVVVTAGRSGQVVPPGHTVRPTRAPRRALEEMFRQSGVIHAANTHQLVDVAQLLSHQPLPTGRRVGILTSAAALTAAVAEAIVSAGLEVAEASAYLPEDADAAAVDAALDALYAPDACDAVMVVNIPTLRPRTRAASRSVARAAARSGRTTVVTMLGLHGLEDELAAPDADGVRRHVPAYSTADDAVQALGAVARYARWRAEGHSEPVRPSGIDRARARAVVEAELLRGARAAADGPAPVPPLLDEESAGALLAAYGIHLWPSVRVPDADEAVAAAERLGWPVVLKHTAGALRHRADLGAVRLDIGDAAELRAAVQQVRAAVAGLVPAVAPGPLPFEVQRMAGVGVACVVRSTEDPLYGPVVSFGLAGDAVDLLEDMTFGIPPLTVADVGTMVRSIGAAPRLFGYGGAPVVDLAALEDLLGRVSVMADDLPELRSLELYPVLASDAGCSVLTARIRLESAQRTDALRRALPS